MAMAVDNRQQSQLSSLGYEQIRYPQPQFTNPWVNNASNAPPSHLYAASLGSSAVLDASQQSQRSTTLSIPSYSLPVTAAGLGTGSTLSAGLYPPQSSIDMSQDLLNGPRSSYASQFATSGSSGYVPTSASGYPMEYATSKSPHAYQQDFARRSSHPSVNSSMAILNPQLDGQRRNSLVDFDDRLNSSTTQAQRNSFNDAIDASRGMVAMSQSDITPRNIYGAQGSSRSSSDSYGFPSTHSAHSSISSASTYPSYYNGSVAGSEISDYSSASESVDMNSRTLPRPSAFGANIPPAPQSMMGQFSSKVSSSSQKKHKCKICDKRFTRPSSLQTHMYSHTGEKPFACEVEGCGRHFSVVSNLRRHRKVHKGEGRDHPSPEE